MLALLFSLMAVCAMVGRKALAAAAWVVYFIDAGVHTLLAFEGKLMSSISSAFQAEVIALDLAAQFFKQYALLMQRY